MRLLLFLIALTFGATSHAQILIECGQDPQRQSGGFESTEFSIWSESEELSGPAGGTWTFFDSDEQESFNADIKMQKDGSLVMEVTHSQSLQGPVGYRYHFGSLGKDGYARHVQAVKESMGGFTAGVKLAILDCRIDALETSL